MVKLDEESHEALRHVCWCCFCDCGGMPKMPKYSPPKDVVQNAWWCCYCFCGGCGLGPVPSPCVGWVCKQICLRETCETGPCWDRANDEGICFFYHRCGCATAQCQCPPSKGGNPICMCLGCNCGRTLFQDCKKAIMDIFWLNFACCGPDPCWLCYCCCSGCGIHELTRDRPFYQSITKCCCCRSEWMSALPTDLDGCCMGVYLCCCWYVQFQLPPVPDNPVCSCCNRFGKPGAPACAVPQQEEMDTTYGKKV